MNLKILSYIYIFSYIYVHAQKESAYVANFNDSVCSFDVQRSHLGQEYKALGNYIMDVLGNAVTGLQFYKR